MIRNLLFIAVMALTPSTGMAQRACQTLDWLVRLHHLSLSIEQIGGANERVMARSRTLLNLLDDVPITELHERLAREGLPGTGPGISGIDGFIRTQRLAARFRLANPGSAPLSPGFLQKMQRQSRAMGSLISTLRCKADPTWRAAAAATSPTSPDSTAAPVLKPRPPGPVEAWTFSLPPLSLIAGLLLLIPVGHHATRLLRAWKDTRRRRYRRFVCNLYCIVTGLGPGSTRATGARVVDISQLGAKLYLGEAHPAESTAVYLQLSDRRIEARIIWRNALFCGLVFRHALPRAELHKVLRNNREGRRQGRRNDAPCHEIGEA